MRVSGLCQLIGERQFNHANLHVDLLKANIFVSRFKEFRDNCSFDFREVPHEMRSGFRNSFQSIGRKVVFDPFHYQKWPLIRFLVPCADFVWLKSRRISGSLMCDTRAVSNIVVKFKQMESPSGEFSWCVCTIMYLLERIGISPYRKSTFF